MCECVYVRKIKIVCLKEVENRKCSPEVDPIQLFFVVLFPVKLGHFTISNFFLFVKKHVSLPAKNRKNLC